MPLDGTNCIPDLDNAIRAWRRVLPASRAVFSGKRLDAVNRSTLPHDGQLAGALYPATRGEAAECLAVARTFRIPLKIVSRGCNWGYGSRLPDDQWAVLVSLEKLTRIEVDERLAKVSLEPGVTFGQLAQRLRSMGSDLLPPSIGAGPDTSILGNALQRGIGKGPYAAMGNHVLGLDVLLTDGTLVLTDGVGAFPDQHHGQLACSAGPSLVGLFQQSNLGIVLAGTIALSRMPRFRQLLWRRFRGKALGAAVEAIRPLLQSDDPRLQIEIVNGERVHLQTFGQLDMNRDRIDAEWLMVATIWGDSRAELEWRISAVRDACRFKVEESGVLPPEGREAFDGLDREGLNSAYAPLGRRPGRRADPDRDGCGVIWIAPELPMLGETIGPRLAQIGRIAAGFDLKPAVSMRPHAGRELRLLISLNWDRRDAAMTSRAAACARAIGAALDADGIGRYRTGVLDQARAGEDHGRKHLLAALARALDPEAILSCPADERGTA